MNTEASLTKIHVFPNKECYEQNAESVGDNDLSLIPLLDLFYPVGTIYMDATGSIDPNTQFGGTWIKIENAFLYGSGTKTIGTTGGEEKVTLTVNQIPSHQHSRGQMDIYGKLEHVQSDEDCYMTSSGAFTIQRLNNPGNSSAGGAPGYNVELSAGTNWTGKSGSTGDGQSHNNMPPYKVVAIWERTA